MYLQDGTRAHFMRFLEQEFPHLRPRFERLYARKNPPEAYTTQVKAMVRVLQGRYGLSRRAVAASSAAEPPPAQAEQVAFRWD